MITQTKVLSDESYTYSTGLKHLCIIVPQVALKSELFVVEEVQHSTNICVVVVSEPIHMTVSVTISTVGGTARGIVTVTIFGVVCISNDNNIIIMIINVNGMYTFSASFRL